MLFAPKKDGYYLMPVEAYSYQDEIFIRHESSACMTALIP
jgi:hypothetical protein